jgi:hypothetical protein
MPRSPHHKETHARADIGRGGSPLIPTHGSPGVPQSVWLPPAGATTTPALAGSTLPGWALERACTQFAPQGGPAAVLLPPGPGYGERTARPTRAAPGWLSAAAPVELADVGRARLALALLLAEPTPTGEIFASIRPQAAAGFFAQIRAALRPGGVLLIHTHPAHTIEGLRDPAGALLRAARTAGLAYLQHLVLVHHRPTLADPGRTRRCAAPRPVHARVHTDLYLLLEENGATA